MSEQCYFLLEGSVKPLMKLLQPQSQFLSLLTASLPAEVRVSLVMYLGQWSMGRSDGVPIWDQDLKGIETFYMLLLSFCHHWEKNMPQGGCLSRKNERHVEQSSPRQHRPAAWADPLQLDCRPVSRSIHASYGMQLTLCDCYIIMADQKQNICLLELSLAFDNTYSWLYPPLWPLLGFLHEHPPPPSFMGPLDVSIIQASDQALLCFFDIHSVWVIHTFITSIRFTILWLRFCSCSRLLFFTFRPIYIHRFLLVISS